MTNQQSTPTMPNIELVRAKAFADWKKEYRHRLGVQERIGQSVPWWLVGIAAVFYLLSAPHTAATFNLLTPGWGFVAPVGIELGTVYVAFQRFQLRTNKQREPLALAVLFFLVVSISILVNGAGALSAVVANVNLSTLSVTDMIGQFVTFPATTQVALVLVPISALVIPVGALVAGEGVAALILERRTRGDLLEHEWQAVRASVEFMYFRDAAVQAGISPRQAMVWAASLSRDLSMSGAPIPSGGPTPEPTRTEPRTPRADELLSTVQRPQIAAGQPNHGNGQGFVRVTDARQKVQDYLSANPSAVNLSVRDLGEAVGVGKTIAGEELKKFKGTN